MEEMRKPVQTASQQAVQWTCVTSPVFNWRHCDVTRAHLPQHIHVYSGCSEHGVILDCPPWFNFSPLLGEEVLLTTWKPKSNVSLSVFEYCRPLHLQKVFTINWSSLLLMLWCRWCGTSWEALTSASYFFLFTLYVLSCVSRPADWHEHHL